MVNTNLRSANGPVEGLFHYPGNNRPGNNSQDMPGVVQYSNKHKIQSLSSKAVFEAQSQIESQKVLPYGGSERCSI